MSPMTSIARIAMTALLAAALAIAACGVKGDPIRPESDQEPEEQSSN